MGLPVITSKQMTYAEFLAFEEQSEERHTYWDGEVFAMTGGSLKHSTLQANLLIAVGTALRGHPCRAYGEGRRLRAPGDSSRSVYPDVVVVCGPSIPHEQDSDATTNPKVVFEVLSDSTESFDRGRKFAYYRSFSSLSSYVLLSQDQPLVELFRRRPDGIWEFVVLRAGSTLELPEAGLSLAVDAIYEGVTD